MNKCYSCDKPSSEVGTLTQQYRNNSGCLTKTWECVNCRNLSDKTYFSRQAKLLSKTKHNANKAGKL